MFSRLVLPVANRTLFRLPQRAWCVATTTSVAKPNPSAVAGSSEERDIVNFPQPVQPLYGGKVRLAFLPDEWFNFFYKKTGVTGPYLFGAGLITFVFSKEWFIVDHEFHLGVSLVAFWTIIIKTFGPKFTDYIDKEREEYMHDLKKGLEDTKQDHIDAIKGEEKEQWRTEAQTTIFEAKKENVALQLEAEYRKRLLHTYEEVKKRLDYHVATIMATRQVHHKHMVNWIINNVMLSITPQQEEDSLKKCISDLKKLSAA